MSVENEVEKLRRENARLARQVDELQARGTELLNEARTWKGIVFAQGALLAQVQVSLPVAAALGDAKLAHLHEALRALVDVGPRASELGELRLELRKFVDAAAVFERASDWASMERFVAEWRARFGAILTRR